MMGKVAFAAMFAAVLTTVPLIGQVVAGGLAKRRGH